MAHFDEAAAAPVVARALEGMQAPSLYLVGAFQDAGGTGAAALDAALQVFQRAAAPVHLRLFCAGALNTGTNGAPLCQSVALDLHASPPAPFPAAFADRGPALPARRAQLWLPACAVPASIYSPASGRLDFRHRAGGVSPELRELLEGVASCSDWELLVRLSTSPCHELPHVAKGGGGWARGLRRRCREEGRQGGSVLNPRGWAAVGGEAHQQRASPPAPDLLPGRIPGSARRPARRRRMAAGAARADGAAAPAVLLDGG